MTAPALRRNHPNQAVIDRLKEGFGERVLTAASVCEPHGQDESYRAPAPPDAVVFAQGTDEVAEIVKLCATHKVPVSAFGTGTSLEGHVAALEGGICIDLSPMNRVLRGSAEGLACRLEAGVTRRQLNAY